MPVLDAFAGVVLALFAVAALAGIRRGRLEASGAAATRTHPFLVGVYRGLAVVVLAFVAVIVANIGWRGSGVVVIAIYLLALPVLLVAGVLAHVRAR